MTMAKKNMALANFNGIEVKWQILRATLRQSRLATIVSSDVSCETM